MSNLFAAQLGQGLRGLRIGIPRTYFCDALQPEVEHAWRAASDVLRWLGAEPVAVAFTRLDDAVIIGPTISRAETFAFHHDRFVVPSLGVVALAAGRTLDAIDRRHRGLAIALALALAAPGLTSSASYAWHLTKPGTRDRVADWTASHLPESARILNLPPYLELDRTRFEVLGPSGSSRLDPYLARHVDFVVAAPEQASLFKGAVLAQAFDPLWPESGPPLAVFRVAASAERFGSPPDPGSGR